LLSGEVMKEETASQKSFLTLNPYGIDQWPIINKLFIRVITRDTGDTSVHSYLSAPAALNGIKSCKQKLWYFFLTVVGGKTFGCFMHNW